MGGAGGAATGPEWDGHLLLLHDSDTEREHAVIAALETHGVDAATAVAEGRLALLPLAEFYPTEGQRQVVDRALAEGFPAVRMSAGASAALTVLSPGDYLSLEWRMDELARSLPVSALCR